MAFNIKAATPDTSLAAATGFVFGADTQASADPSIYSLQTLWTALTGSTTVNGSTVTTSKPVLDLTQAWNDAGVAFTGLVFTATDTASAAASLLMNLKVGSTSMFSVQKNGKVFTTDEGLNIGAGGLTVNAYGVSFATWGAGYGWTSGASYAHSSGNLKIVFGSGASRVCFGDDTSSYPALKRLASGNALQVLAADGTASAGFIVGNQALATNATDNFLYVPTCAGTPTGTPTAQTGTAPIVVDTTNNKLYFYSGAAWRDAGP